MAVINSSTIEGINNHKNFVNENETHSHLYVL